MVLPEHTAQIWTGDPVTCILGGIAQHSPWITMTSGPTDDIHIISVFLTSFDHKYS